MISRIWQAILRASSGFSSFKMISSVGLAIALPLESFWIISGVFETIVGRFLDAYVFELRFRKRLQAMKNLDAQIFCRRDRALKCSDIFIERLVVKRLKHFALDKT